MRTADHELARYRLLASAVAGRFVDVAPVDDDRGPAWTDGATIFADANAHPRDVQCAIVVQASLLASGSLAPDVVGKLGRRASVARRYLTLEGHRALAAQHEVLPAAVRALVDTDIAARSASPEASLRLALGGETIAEPPARFGAIRPRRLRSSIEPPAGAGPSADAARAEQLQELDERVDDDAPVVDIGSSSVGRGGAIGRRLKELFADGRSRAAGAAGAAPPTHWTRRTARGGRRAARSSSASTVPANVGLVEHGDRTYPEWDVNRRQYRPDWCTVVDVEETREDAAPPRLGDVHALRRPLARLGVDLERRHRQLQGDDIDIDAAIDAHVSVRAGTAPDEAIYLDSIRCRRDLSVLVLLDVSGSAAETGVNGKTVHEQQQTVAGALLVALHEIGDRVALYGFRSSGRSAVHVIPVKRFDATLDARALRRLAGLGPAGYTRLGAAIRHGAAVLEDECGTPRRALVVVSDGFAYDHGYEGDYGEADARRALSEARRRGIACVCISVGATTQPDALRRVFGSAAHALLPRPEQLADLVGPLFRSALRAADSQRRAWQRAERTLGRLHDTREDIGP
jgi:hypothetical protein